MDIIFVCDFAQFPPVKDEPLYYGTHSDTPLKPAVTPRQQNIEIGRCIWKQLTNVFILDEQVQIKDKFYNDSMIE